MWLDALKGSLVEQIVTETYDMEWKNSHGPEVLSMLQGDDLDIEILSEELREIFLSTSKGERQSTASIAGNNWRRFVWCLLSLISLHGNELIIFDASGRKMADQLIPRWLREHLRISVGYNEDISIEPNFLMLDLNYDRVRRQLAGEGYYIRGHRGCGKVSFSG